MEADRDIIQTARGTVAATGNRNRGKQFFPLVLCITITSHVNAEMATAAAPHLTGVRPSIYVSGAINRTEAETFAHSERRMHTIPPAWMKKDIGKKDKLAMDSILNILTDW
ncbi:MAG: hypothetical protein ACI3ZC_02395 [Candidatus Cryptobacteroides sp.]